MNTYLVYTRFRLMRGEIDAGGYAQEISLVRERLGSLEGAHWKEFLAAWDGRNGALASTPSGASGALF
jgi:hypothetical protein